MRVWHGLEAKPMFGGKTPGDYGVCRRNGDKDCGSQGPFCSGRPSEVAASPQRAVGAIGPTPGSKKETSA